MKAKAKQRKQHVGAELQEPIENYIDLQFPLNLELRGRQVGALVLGKGARVDRLKFVFGFECKGIHSTIRDEQKSEIFDAIESALKDIPYGETLTIHMGSYATAVSRQQELTQLFHQAQIPQLKFLIKGEKKRVQELQSLGVRKPKTLRLYVTFTVETGQSYAADVTERLLYFGHEWWQKVSGTYQHTQAQKLEESCLQAFTDGFQRWEQLLMTKMGLDLKPMSIDTLWAATWSRFNDSAPLPLPQLVTMSESGLSEHINTTTHASSYLIRTCPVDDRRWIRLNDQRYVGVLTFEEKPAGWRDKFSQLRYIWEVLSREAVRDTEFFCEISRANEELVVTNIQRLTKQATVARDFAAERGSIDVSASLRQQKTIHAQEQILEGAVPLYVASVFLVHRQSQERLDEACRYIESCIRRPALVERETRYAWRVWLQTTKLSWANLLQTPFNRRAQYLCSEAPAFMSLIKPRECDRCGFELVAEEGGSPLFIDLFTQHRNLGLFATTRGGKSVLVSAILTQALAWNMPIVAMDFPKPDGSSTFTDYTQFMGSWGAYFDISTEANNLFEMPDLRALPLALQQERRQDYVSFLEGALLTMVLGGSTESALLRGKVRSMLVIILETFFSDPVIMKRYDTALTGGFGSSVWKVMPTLNDFLSFCDFSRLQVDETSELREAMGHIQLQLKFWVTSRVGKAISAPSSFPTDAKLLVFALRNLNDDQDAAILALSAYSAALRRALSSTKSIFFIDESPILFQFDDVSALVARLCANGAKAGIRVVLSGQDPDTIAQSPSASKILQNLSTRLIGRIQPTAIESFVRYLNYPRAVISRNAGESFFPKREGVYSQWLLDDSGIYTFARFYPSYEQLAAVANNADEQECRTAFLEVLPNRYEALSAFAQELVASLRDNRSLKTRQEILEKYGNSPATITQTA